MLKVVNLLNSRTENHGCYTAISFYSFKVYCLNLNASGSAF